MPNQMGTMTSIRQPAVAGLFYPADAGGLQAMLAAQVGAPPWPIDAKAIIAPHAGYVYSGPIAGTVYAALAHRADQVRRIVLLGPAHRLGFRGIALPAAQAFASPLGLVPIDRDALAGLAGLPEVMVLDRAFDQEHALEVHLPFLQHVFHDFTLVPLVVGEASALAVEAVLERLWGGPETLIVISSDLSHYESYDAARQRDGATSKLIETHRGGDLDGFNACGCRAIAGLLRRAAALDLRATTLDLRNSGDTAGDRQRVVGYGAYSFEYAEHARLPETYRAQLLAAVRRALDQTARKQEVTVEPDAYPPALHAARRTFVTLRTPDGQLRGCAGSLEEGEPLIVNLLKSTIRSAAADPRFKPVTPEEAAQLSIGISIMSHDRPIAADSEPALIDALRPDHDGLIIRDGEHHQALFLPQVWESLPHPRAFVHQLKLKAGLAGTHWSPTFRAWRFTTESF
jgi:AmmeMemoRadiSam system protein B/AmmeMemoRadiSam system protein A